MEEIDQKRGENLWCESEEDERRERETRKKRRGKREEGKKERQ